MRLWRISCALALVSVFHSPVIARSDAPSSSYYDTRSAPNQQDPQSSYWNYSQEESRDKSSYRNLPPPPPPQQNYTPESSYEQQYQSSHRGPIANANNDANEFPSSQSRFQESPSYNEYNSRSSPPEGDLQASKIPIHYDFPSANDDAEMDDDQTTKFASARRDLITTYMSTKKGKVQVMASSTMIGGCSGIFLAKSAIPIGTPVLGSVGAISFLVGTLFRTPFGELVRALGLSLILVLQRTTKIRKTYPTWRYVAAFFGISSRNLRPFPPARNPWKYKPKRSDDVDFSMLYSIIAMAFVGSFCGGNMPVIPTWMGSLAGAGIFALGCTLSSARGDLYRTMGMRVVALLQELWDIQADLKIIPKTAVVSSQVLDKLMIFDRKHKVKDRFLSFATRGYDQVIQMKEGGGTRDGRDSTNDERGERRSRDRPYGHDGDRDKADGSRSFSRDRDDTRERRDYNDNRGEDRARDRFRDGNNAYQKGEDADKEEKPKQGGFWRK